MRVTGGIGLLLLLAGVVMGLIQGFVAYYPYSIYYGVVVVLMVGIGLYAIHRNTDDNDTDQSGRHR